MPNSRFIRSLFALSILAFSLTAASAQIPGARFNRTRTFDVEHYRISVAFKRNEKAIVGNTVVTLKPLASGLTKVALDAVGLRFSSVKLSGGTTDLPFVTDADSVVVTLPRAYGKEESISIQFNYSAQPKKGVYFVDEFRNNGRTVRDAQIWTQGETEEARYWFPSYDFPDDKATSEEYITARDGETVIGNGELRDTKDNGDGTRTFHFYTNIPHSTYLTSFIVGRFIRLEDSYRDIPLGFFLFPDRQSAARSIFAKTKDMMRAYEELTGVDYPYNKYDQTIVSEFNFGGMENITATTLSDRDVFLAETPLGKELVEDLISHELAHSWFGNLVTCTNWAELWLNEGFATFMEAAWREKAYGRDNYIAKLRSDISEYFFTDERTNIRHGLYNLRARPDDSIFDSTTYKKGGAVVHMLRDTVGDEVFWKAINRYLKRHRFGNVASTDLKTAFEEESGKDLGWFFEQWVYGVGHPVLRINSTYSPSTKSITVNVNQTQAAGRNGPSAYRIPLDLEIATESGSKTVTMNISKRSETATFRIGARPKSIDADPAFRVPVKIVDVRPTIVKAK